MASPTLSAPRRPRTPELLALTVLSAFVHFWRLFTPRDLMFDEVYYEKFAGFYLTGQHFFDVHPPLGRLIYTAFAAAFSVPSRALTMPVSFPEFRVIPALFGTALVPLVFVLLRQVGASRRIATLGAIGVLFDNALLVISRAILADIFIIVFGLAAVVAYLAARKREGGAHWAFVAASALLAGAAFSVKWTGASGLGIVLALWAYDLVRTRAAIARRIAELALLIALPAGVYLGSWAIHFSLLTRTGVGDPFMSVRFQQHLIGSQHYDPTAPPMSFWDELADVHRAIEVGNAQLERISHPSASPWYTWPVMKHPVPVWEAANARDGSHTVILLLGNPVVWWWALLGTLVGVGLFVVRRERWQGQTFGLGLLLGAALLNYVPFMAIKRVMYLYHYLFALTLLIALAALSTGVAARWTSDAGDGWEFSSRRSKQAYIGLVVLIVASFLFFAPFTYGYRMSASSWDAHFWVLRPRF